MSRLYPSAKPMQTGILITQNRYLFGVMQTSWIKLPNIS